MMIFKFALAGMIFQVYAPKAFLKFFFIKKCFEVIYKNEKQGLTFITPVLCKCYGQKRQKRQKGKPYISAYFYLFKDVSSQIHNQILLVIILYKNYWTFPQMTLDGPLLGGFYMSKSICFKCLHFGNDVFLLNYARYRGAGISSNKAEDNESNYT